MNAIPTQPTFEFHVSRQARDLYRFEEILFAKTGNVIFANFYASRQFAQKINEKRDLIHYPEQAIRASDINAMGLIDEILHMVIELFRKDKSPLVMKLALEWLDHRVGQETVDATLLKFIDEFPPSSVYKGETDAATYLQGESEGIPHRQVALEELLMLWIANANPAFSPFLELFDDSKLEKETKYKDILQELHSFFDTQPTFGPDDEQLVDMLRSPAIQHPYSLLEQLDYIRKKWGSFLGKYLYHLLSSLDFLKEEAKVSFEGPGPSVVLEFGGLDVEEERFSRDADWMPKVIMLAKNTYVWLDQLARKYNRSVDRLDQIPDEELDELAEYGFTSLWLIGLWERSRASKRIKQMCGNPDAVASAYSLYDYQIANDLGGEAAYNNLKERAWKRGIRMAGDMVPNHVGIDGRWVIEHPDRFLALEYSPFPSYSFEGPNLSDDERVGIFLEDHYYSRSDAAVVFKRVDFHTGSTKYIYHGNDGTSMPWNDTAQVNFLNPEAREAVIQVILHVARQFPIIRFDAAMTLAKRHIQRLWFPEPGTGGAIASRAEHGLTKADFDQAIPKEFWREVVDRIATEAPDTLLLAEAFWMLEGYFVRTLGMHRVYNSAFMNMLKKEENQNYRNVIKNTIQFDPEILKRYVNFMNNPDEETAVAQFGKDDKYFGVTVLLSTMPGLPMFGHGQIEGFSEKYGMEFRRAYWDEKPDLHLVERHRREIFPLLRRRYVFANVDHFLLYDVFTPEGYVNEDVFAYSNRQGDERALVLYNNKFSNAKGNIKMSAGFSVKTGKGDERRIIQKSLGEGLDLRYDENWYCIFRDSITGLEYIRNNKQIHDQGLFIDLGAFKYQVFLDFRQVEDNEWHHYRDLHAFLDGRGVPNVEDAMREIFLQPIHNPFKELVNASTFEQLMQARRRKPTDTLDTEFLDQVHTKTDQLVKELILFSDLQDKAENIAASIRDKVAAALQLPSWLETFPALKKHKKSVAGLVQFFEKNPHRWVTLFNLMLLRELGKITGAQDFQNRSRSWIDEYFFGKLVRSALHDAGWSEEESYNALLTIKVLTGQQRWFEEVETNGKAPYKIMQRLLKDQQLQQMIRVNRYQDVLWFNKEQFDELMHWLWLTAALDVVTDESLTAAQAAKRINERAAWIKEFQSAQKASNYRIDALLDALK